jgi:hypothetical protein
VAIHKASMSVGMTLPVPLGAVMWFRHHFACYDIGEVWVVGGIGEVGAIEVSLFYERWKIRKPRVWIVPRQRPFRRDVRSPAFLL